MDPEAFFAAYADDHRRDTIPSFDRESFDHLVRYTARLPEQEGMVMFATLTPGMETEQIREQIDHFAQRHQGFEWKVHALDRPHDLRSRLTALGFVADDEEAFMAFTLAKLACPAPRRRSEVEVRRIVDEAGIRDVLAVQRVAWGEDFDWLHARLGQGLRDEPDALSIYCAYREGRPVGSGWTDFPADSRFPEMRGGSVIEAARGTGVYAALFDIRLREAERRGYDVVCVDALPMSRPILEHVGFEVICTMVPMRRPAA